MYSSAAIEDHQILIELCDHSGERLEAICRALVDLVVSALPSEDAVSARGAHARGILLEWLHILSSQRIERKALLALEEDLLEAVHDNPSKLGLVGRFPHDIPGKIVDEDELARTYERTSVSGIIVMSLALKRMIALHRIGSTFTALPMKNQ